MRRRAYILKKGEEQGDIFAKCLGEEKVHVMFPKMSPEKLKHVVGQKSIVAATGQKSGLTMMIMKL